MSNMDGFAVKFPGGATEQEGAERVRVGKEGDA